MAKQATKTKKRRQFTAAQKTKILAAAETTSVAAASKRFKVTESSIYSWRSRSAKKAVAAKPKVRKRTRRRTRSKTPARVAVQTSQVTALKKENQNLRNMVVDQLLVIKALQAQA